MHEVVDNDKRLRIERIMNHAFLMSVSTFHKPLIITDDAINIKPTLHDKIHIFHNSINLIHTFGTDNPKVEILLVVETINDKTQATIDVACLSNMAERGQINDLL